MLIKLLMNSLSCFVQNINEKKLETSMRGSDFIFCHRVSFKSGGSYIESLDLIKNKKSTINLKNDDDKHFQYGAIAILVYQEIESHPDRVHIFNHL